MPEDLRVPEGTKEEKYRGLLPQVAALLDDSNPPISNMANLAAALMETFHFLWVGFYRAQDGELVLYPFQGPVACTRIAYGRGVCGTAYAERRSIIVPDVEAFPGHISCNSRSRSEIVIPLFLRSAGRDGEGISEPWGVLDVDSEELGAFDETDAHYLQLMAEYLNLPGG